MEPPVIYLPEEAIETVQKILKLFTRLDRGRMPCELRPIAAGRRDRAVARARGDRLGHQAHRAVAGLRRLGAAAEAEAGVPDLAGDEIRDLRLAGTEVTDERRVPRVAYLGDSSPEGLDACRRCTRPRC